MDQEFNSSEVTKELYVTESGDATLNFRHFQDLKLDSLKEQIADIELMIQTRHMLHDELLRDMEKSKLGIANQLQDGTLTPEDKTKLRVAIIEIDQKKAGEKLQAFHDISELKKDLREHQRELRDRTMRMEALDSFI